MDISIRPMIESDADRVLLIYAEGIEDGQATFEDNAASLALLRTCGFRVVGRRERIAQRLGQWRSTILSERRSRTVGV